MYGRSSNIGGWLGEAIGKYKPNNELFLIGQGHAGLTLENGVTLSRSTDGVNFTTEQEPLILAPFSTWARDSSSPELHSYLSIVDPEEGINEFSNKFLLYYTYHFRGETIDKRNIAVRNVDLQVVKHDSRVPRVRLELARYYDSVSQRHQVTTSLVKPNFVREKWWKGIYIYTLKYNGMRPLFECYTPAWNDYMVSTNFTECSTGGNQFVKTLGYVWTEGQSHLTTKPLYRCLNRGTKNHFVSSDPDCEGATPEGKLGYAEIN